MAMHYEALLTSKQHQLMLQKAFTCYEDEVLHQTNRIEWKRLVPSLEQWKGYRAIIQHWDLTIRSCCEQDMPKTEFEALEKAILQGYSMDAQILLVAKRFPKTFHVGMIPDFKK